QAARPVQRLFGRVLRERIAALDDTARDDAVEGGPVVAALLGGGHEVLHVGGCDLGQQLDREGTGGGLDRYLDSRGIRGWRCLLPRPSRRQDQAARQGQARERETQARPTHPTPLPR